MKEEQLKDVSDFLLLNGFVRESDGYYINDFCGIEFQDSGYCVADNEGWEMFSDNFNIYWLIGYLTYKGFMPMYYKRLTDVSHHPAFSIGEMVLHTDGNVYSIERFLDYETVALSDGHPAKIKHLSKYLTTPDGNPVIRKKLE